MNKLEPMYRKLLLSENIDSKAIKDIIQDIIDINDDDDKNEKLYSSWDREPIILYVNSFGGSVYDGLALVDIVSNSKTPVYTVCIGSCMSMGLWIFMAGEKRYIGQNSTLMFHDISISCSNEKSAYIKQQLNEMERLSKRLIDCIVQKTTVKKEKLETYVESKGEWYIPAETAIDLKFADGYYKKDLNWI